MRSSMCDVGHASASVVDASRMVRTSTVDAF